MKPHLEIALWPPAATVRFRGEASSSNDTARQARPHVARHARTLGRRRLVRARLATDHDQVCAAAEHGRLGLECTCNLQNRLASLWIVPPLGQIRKNPPGTFHPVKALDV